MAGDIFCDDGSLDDFRVHHRCAGLEPHSLISGVDFTGSLDALVVRTFERFDRSDDFSIGNRFVGRSSIVVATDLRGFGAGYWRGCILGDPGQRSRSENVWTLDHSCNVDVSRLLPGSHGAVPGVSWGSVLPQKLGFAPDEMGCDP